MVKPPIIVEDSFSQSPEEIWKVITEPKHMRKWFFENISDFSPEEGFKTAFNVDAGERQFIHQWKIIEVVPGEKIVYDWQYKGYPGRGVVTFRLFVEGKETKLQVISEGMESFPQDIPEFTRESCIGGWEYFIQERLKDYLKVLKQSNTEDFTQQ